MSEKDKVENILNRMDIKIVNGASVESEVERFAEILAETMPEIPYVDVPETHSPLLPDNLPEKFEDAALTLAGILRDNYMQMDKSDDVNTELLKLQMYDVHEALKNLVNDFQEKTLPSYVFLEEDAENICFATDYDRIGLTLKWIDRLIEYLSSSGADPRDICIANDNIFLCFPR